MTTHGIGSQRIRAVVGTMGVLLMATTLAAQDTTLKITVLDATNGKPLPGAKVVLLAGDDVREQYVGSEGESRAAGLEPGHYTVEVSLAGFKTEQQVTDLSAGPNDITVLLQPFRPISVIQLLATPERYDRMPVVVDGFCSVGFEDDALYLHKDDWMYRVTSNALRIEADPTIIDDRFNRKYVTVFGVFAAAPLGGLYGGRISSIEKVVLLERSK